MCSSFDYSESAISELQKVVTPYMNILLEDKYCQYLFSEINMRGAS